MPMTFESRACAPRSLSNNSESFIAPIISMSLTSVNSTGRIPLLSKTLNNPQMQRIEEIYRARLAILVRTKGNGRQNVLAALINKAPAQVSQWINASKDSKTQMPRKMDRATAREIEAALHLPDGWMDQPVLPEELEGVPNATLPATVATERTGDEPNAWTVFLDLGVLLEKLDATDRKQAQAIIEDLVAKPSDAEKMAAKMVRLLGESLSPSAEVDLKVKRK